MSYSDNDVRNLYLDIDRITKQDNTVTSLKDLQKRPKWKEVNFQDECEGGNLLGDLLLKHATENNNLHVKDFLLNNGCKPLPQEQTATVINEEEEEEQNTSDVKKNRADSNIFATSYQKIKEIVTQNPNITAEEFDEKLKKEKIDKEITNQDG